VRFKDPLGLKSKFEPLGTEGCDYYKEQCECGDEYACKAYDCCQAYGNDEASKCIRGCLKKFDQLHCANLTDEVERNHCRLIAHWECYDRQCLAWGKGLKSIVTPYPECNDAIEHVGGMFPDMGGERW
jgi:hypothetical protein